MAELVFSPNGEPVAPPIPEGIANIVGPPPIFPPSVAVVTGTITPEPEEETSVDLPVEQGVKEMQTPNKKTAKRFYADSNPVMALLLILVTLLAVSSFIVSFAGLYAVASWAVGPIPFLQYMVPIMLDVAIVAFTLALFVERERGESVWKTWLAIGLFAGVSAISNILHTLEVSTASDLPQLLAGAVISGGAPILLALAADKIGVKVFQSSKS